MTLTTQAIEEVIKTDVLGRNRASAARRESLLMEFDKSSLSARELKSEHPQFTVKLTRSGLPTSEINSGAVRSRQRGSEDGDFDL